jgi:hypothetical protein
MIGNPLALGTHDQLLPSGQAARQTLPDNTSGGTSEQSPALLFGYQCYRSSLIKNVGFSRL